MSSPWQLEVAQIHLRPGHSIIVESRWRQEHIKILPLGAALLAEVVVPAHLHAAPQLCQGVKPVRHSSRPEQALLCKQVGLSWTGAIRCMPVTCAAPIAKHASSWREHAQRSRPCEPALS